MVKKQTRFVEKRYLKYDEYLSYRNFLIKMVKNYNSDKKINRMTRLFYTLGEKIRMEDVDLEPQPQHYKIALEEEEYEPEGIEGDPIEISSDEEDEEEED